MPIFKGDRIVEITRPYWFGRLIGAGQTVGTRVDMSDHLWCRRLDDASGGPLFRTNRDRATTVPRAVFCCAFEQNTARSKSGLRTVDPFVADADTVRGRDGDVVSFVLFDGFYGDEDGSVVMRCSYTVANNVQRLWDIQTSRDFRDAFSLGSEDAFTYDAYGGNVSTGGSRIVGQGDPAHRQAWITVRDLKIDTGVPRRGVTDRVVRSYETASRSSFYRAEVGLRVGAFWAERKSLSFATRFRSETFRPGDTAIYRLRITPEIAQIDDWEGFYLRDPLVAGLARYTVEAVNVLGRNEFVELLCHGA